MGTEPEAPGETGGSRGTRPVGPGVGGDASEALRTPPQRPPTSAPAQPSPCQSPPPPPITLRLSLLHPAACRAAANHSTPPLREPPAWSLPSLPIGSRPPPRRRRRRLWRKWRRGKMAAPGEAGGEAAVAQRIDPAREPGLSPEQRRFMAQVELAQRQRALQRRLRGRNVLLALGIGAVTAGICILRAGRGPGEGLGGLPVRSRCAP